MSNTITMEQTNKLIPELRFPEFVKNGEWEKKNFGELLELLSDYTANGSFASLKENVKYYNNEEFAVLVRTTDLDKKDFIPARFTDKRGYDFLSKTSLFGNEIVMANVGSIGKVFRVPYYDKPMTLAPNTYVLKFNQFVDEDFIYQLMLRSEFENKLLSMVGSSTLMAINKANLRSIKITIPFKYEQQKIADCLTSLDELITAHTDKLESLQNHKKGLLQNLFPQEGQKVPNYRFPEFVNDGEWEEEKLGNVCVNIVSGKDRNIVDGKYDLYGSTGIIGKTNIATYVGDYILIARVGANAGFLNRVNSKFGVTDNTLIILLDTNQSVDFIYYHLENFGLNKLIFGSGQPLITGGQLKSIELRFPKNPKEQQKIADCLMAVDNLITAQTEKIEQLKNHKKGLMQGLFPKIEE